MRKSVTLCKSFVSRSSFLKIDYSTLLIVVLYWSDWSEGDDWILAFLSCILCKYSGKLPKYLNGRQRRFFLRVSNLGPRR